MPTDGDIRQQSLDHTPPRSLSPLPCRGRFEGSQYPHSHCVWPPLLRFGRLILREDRETLPILHATGPATVDDAPKLMCSPSVKQSTMLRLPSCQKLWERRESPHRAARTHQRHPAVTGEGDRRTLLRSDDRRTVRP